MEKNQKHNHFIVVDESEQKINIWVPSLFNDKERAAILKIILLKRAAIKEVRVDSEKNSVNIWFDSKQLSKNDLFKVLSVVLANFSEKPSKKDKKNQTSVAKHDGVIRRVEFLVDGMSCPSCALYIEITLNRDKRVLNARVDYKSKKGVVVGFLALNEICAMVNGHGYKAFAG